MRMFRLGLACAAMMGVGCFGADALASTPPTDEPHVLEPQNVQRYSRFPDMWLGEEIIACGVLVQTEPGEYVLYGWTGDEGLILVDGLGETATGDRVQCVRGSISRLDGRSRDEVRRYGGNVVVTHQPNPRVRLSGTFLSDPPPLESLPRGNQPGKK